MEMKILEFSLGLIENIIIFTFASFLFKKRFHSKSPWVIIVLCDSIFTFTISNINLIIKAPIYILMFIISFHILYKEKLYIKTAFTFISLYIFYITDIIVGNLFAIVFDAQFFEVFYSSFVNRTIICLVIKLLNAVIFYALYRMLKKINFEMPKKNWILFNIIIAVFVLITIIFIQMYSSFETNDLIATLFFIVSLTFFIMSIIVVKFFTDVCSGFQNEKRAYMLESNYSSIQNALALQNQTNLKLQKIRHDIKNHLNSVVTLFDNKEDEKAIQLLNDVSGHVDEIGLQQLSQTTGNSLIDSIVAYKAALCDNIGIEFNYVLEPLPEINIEMFDLSAVLSNVIDNAIEASRKCDTPAIDIKIFVYKDYLAILTSNTFDGEVNSKNGDLITSKAESSYHGYGTQIINEISEKHNGTYEWSIKGNRFIANILMEYK